jgi:hypothetical protein
VYQVLHLLSQHQIFLKHFKCVFGTSESEYLGHIAGKVGVWLDPKNIEEMQYQPRPKTIKILHVFSSFIRILSQVCSELWKDCGTSHFST